VVYHQKALWQFRSIVGPNRQLTVAKKSETELFYLKTLSIAKIMWYPW